MKCGVLVHFCFQTRLGTLRDNEMNVWNIPDSMVHGANMGPIWGRQGPGGPHVGPMNFAMWDAIVLDWISVELMI